jgi:hypothetical protein
MKHKDANGWIELETINDLPFDKEIQYHIANNKRVFKSTINLQTLIKWFKENKITHYQEVEIKKSPIIN